jgi:dihydrofolate reductase
MDDTHKIIVAEFTTLDGVIGDPDGTWGEPGGGWALRQGPQVFAGDKFRLGTIMERGALLFGRGTWQAFAQRWPARTGAFADAMNRARKLVASTTLSDVDGWSNSALLGGDLADAVDRVRADVDVAVIGSADVARQLGAAGLVDEYRLLVLPTVVGTGQRLFADGQTADLCLVAADVVDTGVLLRYDVVRGGQERRITGA